MTHIDLFSGIGGFALAAERAGFKTEVFCENDKFCQKVLQKHWPDVPIIEDIRRFDGEKYRGATVLTGGFPCQPFSQAGKRRGQADDRYLWPEMFAVIKDARPRWVIGENVVGIYRMALDQVLTDLESEGYTARTFIIPAAGINAPHKRARVWIIAYASDRKYRRREGPVPKAEGIQEKHREAVHSGRISRASEDASNSGCKRPAKLQFQTAGGKQCYSHASKNARDSERTGQPCGIMGQGEVQYGRANSWTIPWYEAATRFCGMDDGVSNRVDRLKALGNAVVPQIPEIIMRGIKEIEAQST
jgi:DNA (cytosine-5)-methyltransferase 1